MREPQIFEAYAEALAYAKEAGETAAREKALEQGAIEITDDGSQSVGDTGFLWNKTGGSKESCYFREKDMDRCTDSHQYRIGLKTCLDQMIRVVLSVFGKTETFFCQKVDLIRVGIAFCLAWKTKAAGYS